MLEVLIFMYQHYWEQHANDDLRETDEAVIAYELSQAGFNHQDIMGAFDWVKDLRRLVQEPSKPYQTDPKAIRIYSEFERSKIDDDCLSFLAFLERAEVIRPHERDLILDRAMALPQASLSIEDLRWITMMALWDDKRKKDYLFVEDAVFNPKGISLQ